METLSIARRVQGSTGVTSGNVGIASAFRFDMEVTEAERGCYGWRGGETNASIKARWPSLMLRISSRNGLLRKRLRGISDMHSELNKMDDGKDSDHQCDRSCVCVLIDGGSASRISDSRSDLAHDSTVAHTAFPGACVLEDTSTGLPANTLGAVRIGRSYLH